MRKKKSRSSAFGFFHKNNSWKKGGVSFYGKGFLLILGIGLGGFSLYKLFYADGGTSIPVIDALPGYPIRSSGVPSEEKKIAPHVEEYITGQSSTPYVEKLLPPPEKPIVEEVPSRIMAEEEDFVEKSILQTLQKSTLPQKPLTEKSQEKQKVPPSPPLCEKKKSVRRNMQIGPFFFSRKEAVNVFHTLKKKLSLPPGSSLLIQYDRLSKRYRIVLFGISEEHVRKIRDMCAARQIPCSVFS